MHLKQLYMNYSINYALTSKLRYLILILIFLALILIAVIIYVLKKRQKESKRDNKSHIKEIINRNITKINAFPNNKNIILHICKFKCYYIDFFSVFNWKTSNMDCRCTPVFKLFSCVLFTLTGLIISILIFF